MESFTRSGFAPKAACSFAARGNPQIFQLALAAAFFKS
jgi:hypothetical protein